MKKRQNKWILAVLAALLLFGLTACIPAAEPREEGQCEVVRVVDGDTIVVDLDGTEEKVRLIGVDTPESVHPDANKNVPYGKVASDFAKEQLEGKMVTLEYDVEERDRYGRILAYVYLDGVMFNKTLLSEGHAQVDTYPPNVKYVDDFVELQKIARAEEKGLWAENPLAAEATYVGNAGSKTLHLDSCSSVSKMKEENKVYFADKKEAFDAGYTPCKRCNP